MALGRRVLLTTALLIYSGMVSALGMGDIRLHSALNQPLSAEIDLLDVGELSADDIRVVLASSSDFARVGVERLAFLQNLSFTPVIEGNRSRIRVASSLPVREPYLNFLVEITRAKSRLLREYTVLLDPMPSAPEAVSSVAVGVPQAMASPVRAEPAPFVPPAELPETSQGKRHRVASGESLWTIASKYVPGGAQASQSQFMRDVLALNPEAFAGGDPARLNAGAVLLLPDTAVAITAANIAPAETAPMVEAAVQNHSVPESHSTDPVPADDQHAMLRQQLLDELAAGRAENQQLKQMLLDMRLQLEAVSAQLAEQGSAQAVASPQAERATPEVDSVPQVAEPIAVQQAVAEPVPSFRWQDWTLPVGGVLASLLLGGLWFARRNKLRVRLPQAAITAAAPAAVSAEMPAVAVELPLRPAHASVSETEVLEAADIYLTYGRRDEALDVLLRGIERAPEQLDLRLRHLKLLAEFGDVEGYGSAAAGYLQAGGGQAQLQRLLAQHPVLASAASVVTPTPEESPPLDVTFVLNETAVAPLDGRTSTPAEQYQAIEADEVLSVDSQSWLDDFDEAITLGKLPSLVDDAGNFASMPSAEEIQGLMANPEHLVRLNQAVAYIKQGHMESACIILESLATDGDERQRRQISELLAQIG